MNSGNKRLALGGATIGGTLLGQTVPITNHASRNDELRGNQSSKTLKSQATMSSAIASQGGKQSNIGFSN